MPVCFDQNWLHLTFLTMYLSSESFSRTLEQLSNIVFHACKSITEKPILLTKVWPANLALFVYVSTYYIEAIKLVRLELDFNRYVQLTWWPKCNTPYYSATGSVFNSRLWQGFMFPFFVLLLLCFYLFARKCFFT